MSVADLKELPIRIIAHLMSPKGQIVPIIPRLVIISLFMSKKFLTDFEKCQDLKHPFKKLQVFTLVWSARKIVDLIILCWHK